MTHVLLLPGWQNSGPGHWQSLWETRYGYQRVLQHDWMRPLRGDWMMRLEESLLALPVGQPAVLAAHSLGCHLVAAWASHSNSVARVSGALLVAPADTETVELRTLLPSWSPMLRQRLPFRATVLGCQNDPYCAWGRTVELANDWGATCIDIGPCGHINAESGLGDWPFGHQQLQRLLPTSV